MAMYPLPFRALGPNGFGRVLVGHGRGGGLLPLLPLLQLLLIPVLRGLPWRVGTLGLCLCRLRSVGLVRLYASDTRLPFAHVPAPLATRERRHDDRQPHAAVPVVAVRMEAEAGRGLLALGKCNLD